MSVQRETKMSIMKEIYGYKEQEFTLAEALQEIQAEQIESDILTLNKEMALEALEACNCEAI